MSCGQLKQLFVDILLGQHHSLPRTANLLHVLGSVTVLIKRITKHDLAKLTSKRLGANIKRLRPETKVLVSYLLHSYLLLLCDVVGIVLCG